jgi:hypothetical protein
LNQSVVGERDATGDSNRRGKPVERVNEWAFIIKQSAGAAEAFVVAYRHALDHVIATLAVGDRDPVTRRILDEARSARAERATP